MHLIKVQPSDKKNIILVLNGGREGGEEGERDRLKIVCIFQTYN